MRGRAATLTGNCVCSGVPEGLILIREGTSTTWSTTFGEDSAESPCRLNHKLQQRISYTEKYQDRAKLLQRNVTNKDSSHKTQREGNIGKLQRI